MEFTGFSGACWEHKPKKSEMKTLKSNKILAALLVCLMMVPYCLSAQSNTTNNNNSKTTEDKVNAVLQVLGAISNAVQQTQNQQNNNTAVQPNTNNSNLNNGSNVNSNFNNAPATSQPRNKTACAHCKTTGNCPYCNGQGYRLNQFSREKTQCIWCNGNGRCHWCNGRGEL